MIWRDVLFADVWLLRRRVDLCHRHTPRRHPLAGADARHDCSSLFGVLLRPNAIIAAPFLAAYVIWPAAFHWKRVAIILIPGIVAGYALIHIVYYTVLDAERQNPLHSVFVFDLGGISYYSGENKFPVAFTPEQTAMLFTSQCYNRPLGLLLAHQALRFRDAAARAQGRQDLRHAAPHRRPGAMPCCRTPSPTCKHRLTFMWTFLTEPI